MRVANDAVASQGGRDAPNMTDRRKGPCPRDWPHCKQPAMTRKTQRPLSREEPLPGLTVQRIRMGCVAAFHRAACANDSGRDIGVIHGKPAPPVRVPSAVVPCSPRRSTPFNGWITPFSRSAAGVRHPEQMHRSRIARTHGPRTVMSRRQSDVRNDNRRDSLRAVGRCDR